MRMLGGLVVLLLCGCRSPIQPNADGTCPEGWYLNKDSIGGWGSTTELGDGLCYQRCEKNSDCPGNQTCNPVNRCGGGDYCEYVGGACDICAHPYCS